MKRNNVSPGYALWTVLSDTYQIIARTRETQLARYGISAIQGRALNAILMSEEPPTPAQLSRWLVRESHTVSGLLARMEKQGLISKTRDRNRKNQIRITITEKGRKVYADSRRGSSIETIMSSLSLEDQQQLISFLMKLQNKAIREFNNVRQALPYRSDTLTHRKIGD